MMIRISVPMPMYTGPPRQGVGTQGLPSLHSSKRRSDHSSPLAVAGRGSSVSRVLFVPLTDLEPAGPLAPQFSVFVDDSGAKHRRVRRAGRLLGLGLLAYALALVAGVVRPVPFSGARLPTGAPDEPVRVWTVPAVPEAPEGEEVPLPPPAAPAFATAAAGSGRATADAAARTAPALVEPAAPPAAVPVVPVAPAPTAPSPAPPPATSDETAVPRRSDRAPRSGAASAPRAVPEGRGEAAAAPAPADAERQPAPPAAPPAERGLTRGAGR